MEVARHKTALSRDKLSRPMATVVLDGLLSADSTVLDWGCGRGDDVRHLAAAGYTARGWDPVHRPAGDRSPADVVNLGYVINVIEDAQERATCLRQAWSATGRLLMVSARLQHEARDLIGRPFGDGLITRLGSFQRFYQQAELGEWIKATLGVVPVAAAPGIYYLFRDPAHAQRFLADRVHVYRPRAVVDPHTLYQEYCLQLAPLLDFMTRHARPPKPAELEPSSLEGIHEVLGGLGKAVHLLQRVVTAKQWRQFAVARRSELLVYLALSRFTHRPRLTELDSTLAADIKAHFTTYRDACMQGDRLLLASGDPALVLVSARTSRVGKNTPTGLYVHQTALCELPPVLQVYQGCARALAGQVADANIIKLSTEQAQISYLSCPTFDRVAHPVLTSSLTVNLSELSMRWRDYRGAENPPLLHRKEEFIGHAHERRALYESLTAAERRHGLYDDPSRIGTLHGWSRTLTNRGVRVEGHRLRRGLSK